MPKTQNKEEVTEVTEVIEIPTNLQVFDDSRTHAKTVALPFQFPDGVSAILMVSRLQRGAWKPSDFIKTITLTYKK